MLPSYHHHNIPCYIFENQKLYQIDTIDFNVPFKDLKMLFVTLIIDYTFYSMLSRLNEITLQNELQIVMTNDCLDQTQQQQQNNIKSFVGVGNQTRDFWHRSPMRCDAA